MRCAAATAFLALALALLEPGRLTAQEVSRQVPAPVTRRIVQAIWPAQLFDTAGKPQGGWVARPFHPRYSDLHITEGKTGFTRLPRVRIYSGWAYPAGCFHCGTVRRAVAERDGKYVTLMEPEDLALILSWSEPRFRVRDSLLIRDVIVQLLAASELLGPRVERVTSRADLPATLEGWWRPADVRDSIWNVPRTYSHGLPGGLTLEFPVLAGATLYGVGLRFEEESTYDVLVTLAADATLSP
jgi:hypothetical protein